MFLVNNTIDKFLKECYLNDKYIRYIDSSYVRAIPNSGKFWVNATFYPNKNEVMTFKRNKDLADFLSKIDFKNLKRIKISSKYYDLAVIDKRAVLS